MYTDAELTWNVFESQNQSTSCTNPTMNLALINNDDITLVLPKAGTVELN